MTFAFERFLPHIGTLSLLLAGACSPSSNDTPAAQQGETTAPLVGPTWARCWVERDTVNPDFFQTHKLHCENKTPTDYPLKPMRVGVQVDTAAHGSPVAELAPGTDTPGTDTIVAGLQNSDFPFTLRIYVTLPQDSETLRWEPSLGTLQTKATVATVDSITADHAFAFKQPFDLWSMTIRNDVGFYYLQADTSINLDRWAVGQADDAKTGTTAIASLSVIARDIGSVTTVFTAAPREAPLAANYQTSSEPISITLLGPGNYVATAEGLVLTPASPPDTDASTPKTPNVDGGVDGATSTPEASPVDPDPTCGAANQGCCYDRSTNKRSCDTGSYCSGTLCVACGKATQACCYDSDTGKRSCNSGSYCSGSTCTECGQAGQACCYDSDTGKRSCNSGSYCSGSACTACGQVGQACCYDSSNGTFSCGVGSKCSSSRTCVAQ